MAELDWWQPLGADGEVEIRDLVADEALRNRVLATENVQEVALAEFVLAGRQLHAEIGHGAYLLRDGDRQLARLALPTRKGRPWSVQLTGDELAMSHERVDLQPEPESKIEQVYYLLFQGQQRSWVAHFTGGRIAGETLVLAPGDRVRAASPVVSCIPAAQSRQVPRLRLRKRLPADVHALRWVTGATPAEVALGAIIVLAGLHTEVDYLGASFVGAAREVGGIWRAFTPLPEQLPTKPGR